MFKSNFLSKLQKLKDPQNRSRLQAIYKKKIVSLIIQPKQSSICFIMGNQRSGTTMLMNMLHKHKDIEVFDESYNSPVFINYRLKQIDDIKKQIVKSKFKLVAFKPLADSHDAPFYVNALTNLKIIWCVRYYCDVANSHLRKFSDPNHALRKVMEGRSGGGWFQEGISNETLNILNSLNYKLLSEFDLACLIWWARNKLYFDNLLNKKSNCMVLIYERLVSNPAVECKKITRFLGLDYSPKMIKYIHSKSIQKNSYPKLNEEVEMLCEHLWTKFITLTR